MDNFLDENSDEFKEIGTIPNYESVNDNITIPGLLLPPYAPHLFRHQPQSIDRCLFAEGAGPIATSRGIFYSRIGVNANTTGAGKTATMLALAQFPVGEPAIEGNIYASSLSTVIFPVAKRSYVPCSVYLATSRVTTRWKEDCDRFFGRGKYCEFTTEGDIVNNIKAERPGGGYYSGKAGKFSDLGDGELINYIINKMHQYKIIIVAERSFQYIMEVFKYVIVDRLVIDELQDIVITNQDEIFKDYCVSLALDVLLRHGAVKGTLYREESPARFIWLVTATPHAISSNLKSGKGSTGAVRYINMWIDRNAPFLRDYINSKTGVYELPDMIERYIIKFPDSYVEFNKSGGVNFCEPIIIKAKRPIQVIAVEGILGETFDDLLHNDDISAIMSRLKIDNPADMVSGVINDLNNQILALEAHKYDTKLDGLRLTNHITEQDSKIQELQQKISSVISKMERLTANIKSKGHEEICPICKDRLVPQPSKCPSGVDVKVWAKKCILACKACFNPFHAECIHIAMKDHHITTCPICRENITGNGLVNFCDDSGTISVTTQNQEVEAIGGVIPLVSNHIFNNKSEAFFNALEIQNGLMKGLVYLDFNGDNTKSENDIIFGILQKGYDVRLPSAKTKTEIRNIFGVFADRVYAPGAAREVGTDLTKFKESTRAMIWILRASGGSNVTAGLDFPFIDFILCYSKFKKDKIRQINGRAARPSRTQKYKLIIIDFDE